jgi:hypothetical protein
MGFFVETAGKEITTATQGLCQVRRPTPPERIFLEGAGRIQHRSAKNRKITQMSSALSGQAGTGKRHW